jgi:hypothetical protein
LLLSRVRSLLVSRGGSVSETTAEPMEGAWQMARLLGMALVVLALVVAGCGDDDGDEEATPLTTPPPAASVSTTAPSTEVTTLENPADAGGEFAFQKDSLTAPAGEITLVMENPSSEVHNISLEGNGVDEKGELVVRARRRVSQPSSSPASTRSTARCPSTGTGGWKARSRSRASPLCAWCIGGL